MGLPRLSKSILFGSLVLIGATTACTLAQPSEIQGVGVGSECNFTGEFVDVFPCENWQGVSPTPTAITIALMDRIEGRLLIGFASSKPIEAISGDDVLSSQSDGTLGILHLAHTDGSTIKVEATDGSTSKCKVDYSKSFSQRFSCSRWK